MVLMDSTLNERVAEEIRVQLARKNITATELARRAGMTQRSVSRRITGEKVIDVDDLERIAKALDVPVSKLLPSEVSLSWKIPATRRPPRSAVRTIVPASAEPFTGRTADPSLRPTLRKADRVAEPGPRRLYRISR